MSEFDWSNEAHWKRIKIVDLACGSGTLLAACLAEMRRRARKTQASSDRISRLHRIAVEQVLKGFDINPVSLQLAAAQLSIGNAEVRFNRMGLHRMPYGQNQSNLTVNAGTLELLDQSEIVPKQLLRLEHSIESEQVWKTSDKNLDARIASAVEEASDASIVIMNPPFTNREKMGEKFSREEQNALRDRIDVLQDTLETEHPSTKQITDKNTVRPLFTALAGFCLQSNGIFASVVPTVALCAPSGLKERRFLASKYHIHTVVTCHKPRQLNMSQGSNINESLIIARKCDEARKQDTRFVSLDRFPMNEDEATELCDRLRLGNRIEESWGRVSTWPASRMEAGDWSPGIWRDPELAKASWDFFQGGSLIPLASIESVRVHATGQVLRGSFQKSDEHIIGSFPIVRSKGSDGQESLHTRPDEFWISKKDDPIQHRTKLLQKAGHLLITAGQDPSTARVCAVAGDRFVGNGWMPVTGLSLEESQALAVFLNSTVGRLLIMRSRGRKLHFPTYSGADLSNVVVPNVRDDDYARGILVACYKDTHTIQVPQFREGECKVRAHWDQAVSEVSSWDSGYLSDLREKLHREPCVSGLGYGQCRIAIDEEYTD
ncbi:MAG: class I SAM-dependent methyltransferase [Gammaproteobacteria bacterium]|nr:class I SAM-dependent methyltransferase [Gammaproteobacteria bacterium]